MFHLGLSLVLRARQCPVGQLALDRVDDPQNRIYALLYVHVIVRRRSAHRTLPLVNQVIHQVFPGGGGPGRHCGHCWSCSGHWWCWCQSASQAINHLRDEVVPILSTCYHWG